MAPRGALLAAHVINPARSAPRGATKTFQKSENFLRYRHAIGMDRITKGGKVKIEHADQTPRETLEERLDKTPSNARCFAQGSSLMC